MMSHPNITRVHAAAVSESGRPYFVIERVEGEPLTGLWDREMLGPMARSAMP